MTPPRVAVDPNALKAPFPYFGGKSKIAHQVWEALGDCSHYIEPFAGSAACLLARPADHVRRCETINDADGFVANVWRSLRLQPEETARWADWIVCEADLTARHLWLVGQREALTERLVADPEWCDPKAAGWWIWGMAQWIGSGWCAGNGPWRVGDDGRIAKMGGTGVHRKLPHLGDTGKGIHRQLPHLGSTILRAEWIAQWFAALSERLRDVRVCCGDWRRVLSDAAMAKRIFPAIGVFLDPPYLHSTGRCEDLYAKESSTVAAAAAAWCREHGDDPQMRIVLAGYAEEHELPGWLRIAWSPRGWAGGGYGNANKANRNAERETLWLSPACRINDAERDPAPAIPFMQPALL